MVIGMMQNYGNDANTYCVLERGFVENTVFSTTNQPEILSKYCDGVLPVYFLKALIKVYLE